MDGRPKLSLPRLAHEQFRSTIAAPPKSILVTQSQFAPLLPLTQLQFQSRELLPHEILQSNNLSPAAAAVEFKLRHDALHKLGATSTGLEQEQVPDTAGPVRLRPVQEQLRPTLTLLKKKSAAQVQSTPALPLTQAQFTGSWAGRPVTKPELLPHPAVQFTCRPVLLSKAQDSEQVKLGVAPVAVTSTQEQFEGDTLLSQLHLRAG